MKKENIKSYSIDQLMKMKGKTRKDARPGPSLPDDFWKHAKVVYPEAPKEQITVRLDADILEWFKAHGRGYQTRMNAVLRSYVDAHKNEPTAKR